MSSKGNQGDDYSSTSLSHAPIKTSEQNQLDFELDFARSVEASGAKKLLSLTEQMEQRLVEIARYTQNIHRVR